MSDLLARRIRRVEAALPDYDGYADHRRRRAVDRALRLRVAERARDATRAVDDRHRRVVEDGGYRDAARLERLRTSLDHLVDRLERSVPDYGPWLDERRLPDASRLALVQLDRALLAAVDDLGATAASLMGSEGYPGDGSGVTDSAVALVAELHVRLDRRQAVFASAAPPAPPPRSRVSGVYPGDIVHVEGDAYEAAARLLWDRGDRGVRLSDPAAGLLLWQDLTGAPVLFELQAHAVPVPPPNDVTLDGERFTAWWSDAGRVLERGPSGYRRRPVSRWLYRGDAGGYLWVESDALDVASVAGQRTLRGTALAPEELSFD